MAETKSLEQLQQELKDQVLLHGDRHESVAYIHSAIGSVHFDSRDFVNALKSYEAAKEIAMGQLGEDAEFTIDTHYRIGRTLEAKSVSEEKLQQTAEHKKETLRLRRKFDADKRVTIGTGTGSVRSEPSVSSIPDNAVLAVDTENSVASVSSDPTTNTDKRPSDSMDSTLIYHDMAEQARLTGDLDKAQPLYLKSIELRRKKFGDDSAALCPVLLNYAELLRQQGSLQAAKTVLGEALSISLFRLGKVHASTAEAMNNLGQVCRQMGDLEMAEQALTEALFVRRGLFGDLDLSVGATLNNLAELNREQQRFQEAMGFHTLAVEAFTAAGGEEHPGTINAKGNMGITLRRYAAVNEQQGEELLRGTVQYLHSNEYNAQHPWLLKFGAEHALGEAQKLAQQGRHEQSLEVYDSLFQQKGLTQRTPPPSSVKEVQGTGAGQGVGQPQMDVLLISRGRFSSMLGKARAQVEKAKHLEAEETLAQCAAFDPLLLGDASDPLAAAPLAELLLLRACNAHAQCSDASALADQALEAAVDLHGPDSAHLCKALLLVGDVFRARGEYAEAESFLNQAVTLVAAAVKADQTMGARGPHLLSYLSTLVALADLHRNKGEYAVAAQLLAEAQEIGQTEENSMGECYTALAHLERVKGDLAQCALYHSLALDSRTQHCGRAHPKVAASLAHLARLDILTCEFASASKRIQESQDIRQAHYGFLTVEPQKKEVVEAEGDGEGSEEGLGVGAAVLGAGPKAGASNKVVVVVEQAVRPFTHPSLSDCLSLRAELHLALGEGALAKPLLALLLQQRIARVGNSHPLAARCLLLMASAELEAGALGEAELLYQQVLAIVRDLFPDSPSHELATQSIFGCAQVRLGGQRFAEAMGVVEECLGLKRGVVEALGGTTHCAVAAMSLLYGEAALALGLVADSAVLFGQAGVDMFGVFGVEAHLRVSDALYFVAQSSYALGRYKDSRQQLSQTMAIKCRYLGKTHSDVLRIFAAAAENMRAVGYLQDALDAAGALQLLAVEGYGKGSVAEAVAMKLQGHVLCDRGLSVRAEAKYTPALEVLQAALGERHTHVLEVKAGLARCMMQTGRLSNAEKAFKEVWVLARQVLGECHFVMDCLSNLGMCKLNRKPLEGEASLKTLKETLLPYYTAAYGANHPYTVHTQGRVGLFMNMFTKDSGRKHITKALKSFDEYPQYAFTHDHPWVLEIGGFVKRSSQERLSHMVEEPALDGWCMPKFEGDVRYGAVPKHFWIDLKTTAAQAWGQLHFYGLQREDTGEVLPLIAAAREGGSPSNSRAVSPSRKAPTPAPLEGEPLTAEQLTAALQAERAARRDAEDLLGAAEQARRAAEEQLETELARAAEVERERERAEVELREGLEQAQRAAAAAAFAAAAAATAAAAAPTVPAAVAAPATPAPAPAAPVAAPAAAAPAAAAAAPADAPIALGPTTAPAVLAPATEGLAALAATQTGTAPAAVPAATDSAPAAASNPVSTSASAAASVTGDDGGGGIVIEEMPGMTAETNIASALLRDAKDAAAAQALAAAGFLFQRAQGLHDAYAFDTAQPLLEECLRVRTEHAPYEQVTVEVLGVLASNLSRLNRWDESDVQVRAALKLAEAVCGIESVPFLSALLGRAETLLSKGAVLEASKTLLKAAKLATKLGERHPESVSLLGRCVCNQALASLRLGKIPEARAMADRGQAILSKAHGSNSLQVMEALQVKTEIYLGVSKFKEAYASVEQLLSTRRKLLDDKHPLLADGLLLQGRALLGLGKAEDAQKAYFLAREIRRGFYAEDSLEMAVVYVEEAGAARALCQYADARSMLEGVLGVRERAMWAQSPLLGDVRFRLGQVRCDMGHFQEAEALLRGETQATPPAPAAEVQGAPATPTPALAAAQAALGELYRQRGEYSAAKLLLETALEAQKVLFGKENLQYLQTQQLYGLLLRDTGDLVNAEKLNKRTIKYRRQLGEHPDLLDSLVQQVRVLVLKGAFEEAGMFMNEATPLCATLLSDYPLHRVRVQLELVEVRLLLAKLRKREDEPVVVKDEQVLRKEKEEGEKRDREEEERREKEEEERREKEEEEREREEAEKTQPSNDEEVREDIAAAEEAPLPAMPQVLVFPNQDFQHAMVLLKRGVEKMLLLYGGVTGDRPRQSRRKQELAQATAQAEKLAEERGEGREGDTRPSSSASTTPTSSAHPEVHYLQGLVGSALLMEHNAKLRFVETLSVEERERFSDAESLQRLQSREVKNKPPGLVEIEVALVALSGPLGVGEGHCWVAELREVAGSVVFVLDDLEVAGNTFLRAEQLRERGRFAEADAKYEEVFLTQMQSLGAHTASTSLVVAETLLGKAEACRGLGENELAMALYGESLSIYRKQQGADGEGVLRGILGLTALLSAQGLDDEAYAVRTKVLGVYVRIFGEWANATVRLKVALADDLQRLCKYDTAHRAALALVSHVQKLQGRGGRETQADLHLVLARSKLALGLFPGCAEQVDLALGALEGESGQYAGEDVLVQVTGVMEVRAEYLLQVSRVSEAEALTQKALKFRLKSFGRLDRAAGKAALQERKMAFFDALDLLTLEGKKVAGVERRINHQKSRLEEVDAQLDSEMAGAFEEVMASFGGGGDTGTGTGAGGAGLSSAARFMQPERPSRGAYMHRGVAANAHPALADCLLLRGRVCLVLGEVGEAKQLLEGSLHMLSEMFQRPSLKKLRVSHELAELKLVCGGVEEARGLHTGVLEQRLQLCDDEHPDKADSLFRLACINTLLCRYDDSTQILTEALSLRKAVFGDQHHRVGEVFAACATVLHHKGFHLDSDNLYAKAMLIAQRFGDLNVLVAEVLVGQAANARELGLFEQAGALLEQAAGVRAIVLGAGHAESAACMYEQALVKRSLGRILEAKRLLDQAIAIQRERLGKYHPTTAQTLLSLAINFTDLAQFTTAGHVYTRALQLLRRSLGADHVLVAYGMEGQGENARQQGQYVEARAMHEKVLYIRRKVVGERHHSIAQSLYHIAELDLLLANYEEATKGFDDAIALQRMALGQAHPAVATTLHGLGRVLLARGLVGDAKSFHDRAYFIRKSSLQPDHPQIGDSQFCNALVYQRMGKYDQAAALFERCLLTVRDARGARHPLVASIIYHAGEVAALLGRYAQAEALLLEALQIRVGVYGAVNENHPDMAQTYLGLAELLRMRGLYEYLEEGERLVPEMRVVRAALEKQEKGKKEGEKEGKKEEEGEGDSVAERLLDGSSVKAHAHTPALTPAPAPTPISASAPAPAVSRKVEGGVEGDAEIQDLEEIEQARLAAEADREPDQIDDASLPQVHDSRTLTDDPRAYKALPMLRQVLVQLAFTFPTTHPAVLLVQYSLAETQRSMGRFDASLEVHQEVLGVRRKVLGDGHPDSVLSMLAIGEVLQGLGKIYPDTASGAVDAKEVRKARSAVSLGVSLMDHLSSLLTPVDGTFMQAPEGRREKEPQWGFLSQQEQRKKKKEALKLPKGYMGYQFPVQKKIVRKEGSTARPKVVRTGDAKWLFDSAQMAARRTFGEDHPCIAALLYAKGGLLRARGDNASALQCLDQSLSMRRKLFRGSHPLVADCINSMAEVFRIENKFRQALPLYDKAMEIREAAFGLSHPAVAEVKNNLAMLRFAEGKFELAQALFQEALAVCEMLLGVHHPATALCVTNLAALLQASGQQLLALPLYLRALKSKQATYGEGPEVASTLNNLGLLYRSLSRFDEAQSSYEQALALQRAMHGLSHKDIATTLNNLAALHVAMNRRYEAKELYKESVAMRSALFGVDHPTVAATLNNYAGLLFSMGELEPAKDFFDDALRIRRKVLGEDHPAVAETLNNIGLLLYTQGQLKDALPLYERALEIKRLAYGELNPSVATSLNNLASLHHRAGNFDRAHLLYTQALDVRRQVLGEGHEDTVAVEENIKAAKRDKKRFAAASAGAGAGAMWTARASSAEEHTPATTIPVNTKQATKIGDRGVLPNPLVR